MFIDCHKIMWYKHKSYRRKGLLKRRDSDRNLVSTDSTNLRKNIMFTYVWYSKFIKIFVTSGAAANTQNIDVGWDSLSSLTFAKTRDYNHWPNLAWYTSVPAWFRTPWLVSGITTRCDWAIPPFFFFWGGDWCGHATVSTHNYVTCLSTSHPFLKIVLVQL